MGKTNFNIEGGGGTFEELRTTAIEYEGDWHSDLRNLFGRWITHKFDKGGILKVHRIDVTVIRLN